MWFPHIVTATVCCYQTVIQSIILGIDYPTFPSLFLSGEVLQSLILSFNCRGRSLGLWNGCWRQTVRETFHMSCLRNIKPLAMSRLWASLTFTLPSLFLLPCSLPFIHETMCVLLKIKPANTKYPNCPETPWLLSQRKRRDFIWRRNGGSSHLE